MFESPAALYYDQRNLTEHYMLFWEMKSSTGIRIQYYIEGVAK